MYPQFLIWAPFQSWHVPHAFRMTVSLLAAVTRNPVTSDSPLVSALTFSSLICKLLIWVRIKGNSKQKPNQGRQQTPGERLAGTTAGLAGERVCSTPYRGGRGLTIMVWEHGKKLQTFAFLLTYTFSTLSPSFCLSVWVFSEARVKPRTQNKLDRCAAAKSRPNLFNPRLK